MRTARAGGCKRSKQASRTLVLSFSLNPSVISCLASNPKQSSFSTNTNARLFNTREDVVRGGGGGGGGVEGGGVGEGRRGER